MQIFRNKNSAEPHDYNGPREADGIVTYLKRQAGPATLALAAAADVAGFKGDNDVAVVGVFTGEGCLGARVWYAF